MFLICKTHIWKGVPTLLVGDTNLSYREKRINNSESSVNEVTVLFSNYTQSSVVITYRKKEELNTSITDWQI